jgi:hypothetical protein
MYILKHKRTGRIILVNESYISAMRVYRGQWPDDDGSIPWDIIWIEK